VEEGKDTKIRSFVYSAAVTETSALSFNWYVSLSVPLPSICEQYNGARGLDRAAS
jgi:hypothetical protein